MTKDPADDYMPTWSPDDKEIAFASTRGDGQSVWAVQRGRRHRAQGGERRRVAWTRRRGARAVNRLPGHHRRVQRPRSDRPLEIGRQDDDRRRERLRVPRVVGERDGVLLRLGRQDPQARDRRLGAADGRVHRDAAGHPRGDGYTRRKRDFTSTAPRQVLGIVRPVISPDGTQIAFAAVGDIYVMPVGGKPVNLTKDAALDTDPAWSPDGTQLVYSSDKGSAHLQLWIRDMTDGASRRRSPT